jgi:hypothetical protein
VILGVDVTFPFARENAIRKVRYADLANGRKICATNDQIATGVAIVIFWPAAFLVGGDGQVAAQLSQLQGQLNAVEQASIQKKCGIQFRQAPPAES